MSISSSKSDILTRHQDTGAGTEARDSCGRNSVMKMSFDFRERVAR